MKIWDTLIGGMGIFSLVGNILIGMATSGGNRRWLRICTNHSEQPGAAQLAQEELHAWLFSFSETNATLETRFLLLSRGAPYDQY